MQNTPNSNWKNSPLWLLPLALGICFLAWIGFNVEASMDEPAKPTPASYYVR